MSLTREQILAANDLPTDEVQVPEWGKDAVVFVRGMSAEERDQYDKEMFQMKQVGNKFTVQPTMKNIRAKLVALCTIDPTTSNRIFTDADIEALSKKSSAPIARIAKKIQSLSGMDAEAEELLGKD